MTTEHVSDSVNLEDVQRGFDAFWSQNKSRVGLMKSEKFNSSMIDIAMRDVKFQEFCVYYIKDIKYAGDPKTQDMNSAPYIITYFRGIKNTLKILLQVTRKAVDEVFGAESLAYFDEAYEKYHFVSRRGSKNNFWPRFGQHLRQSIDARVDAFVYERFSKVLFTSLLETIEVGSEFGKRSGAQVSSTELPSVPYKFALEFDPDDIIGEFNPTFRAESIPETAVPNDHDLADYAELHDDMISTFVRKDISAEYLRGVMALAAYSDKPKNDEPVNDKIFKAVDLESRVEKKQAAMKGKLFKKKTDDDEFEALQAESQNYNEQVVWYARGVLQTIDMVLLEDQKNAAMQQLGAGREFYERVLLGNFGLGPVVDYLTKAVLKRFTENLREKLLRFVYDLKAEALIKDFNEKSFRIRRDRETKAIVLNLDTYLKKDVQFAQINRTLLSLNPEIERELIYCPSTAKPLATCYAKARAAGNEGKDILFDPKVAHLMGDIIHTDYTFAYYMQKSPAFFNFLLANKDANGFVAFMKQLAQASPQMKRAIYQTSQLMTALWHVESKLPRLGFCKYILAHPLDFQRLQEAVGMPPQMSAIINEIVAGLKKQAAS